MLDYEHIFIVLTDLIVASFLIWRIFSKKAVLWGTSKVIYSWISLTSLYHAFIYFYMLFTPLANHGVIITTYLHPIVILFMLNPLLIAIVHWRGGNLL